MRLVLKDVKSFKSFHSFGRISAVLLLYLRAAHTQLIKSYLKGSNSLLHNFRSKRAKLHVASPRA